MPPEPSAPRRANRMPPPGPFPLRDTDFHAIRAIVKERAGITLGPNKQDLVISRLSRRLRALGLASFAQYVSLLRSPRGEAELVEMVNQITTNQTGFFREGHHFDFLRQELLPALTSQGPPRPLLAWSAGCSSGEEAYSLAILLQEEGVYERATIYATDFNDAVLEKAREGIYDIGRLKDATRNYQGSGGKGSFSDYYHARYGAAAMDPSLRRRIVFSNHNLASDSVFSEMHLVFCRNVLIYFNRDLQNRALGLFDQSLVHGGFLCLGTKEDIQFTEVAEQYQALDRGARIFKKVGGP